MRDFGIHTIPNLAALPGSGVAGQLCSVANVAYYWHAIFAAWVPFDEWFDIPLAADYNNGTTTLSTLFTFNGVANAIYEVEWKGLWRGSTTTAGMKQALTVPASALFGLQSVIAGAASGVVTPTFLELGISGTAQNGPPPAVAATPLLNRGYGIINMSATPGAVTLQAAATGTGTLTVQRGANFRYRRLL